MSIAERLKEAQVDGPPWQTCSIEWLKAKLDPKEREAVDELIKLEHISYQKASLIIEEEVGVNVSAQSISRHKRGLCKCGSKK